MAAYKRVSHAIDSLRSEVNTEHPDRDRKSDGTLGDTAHLTRKSDHNPDALGIVHAWDVTVWDDPDPDNLDDVANPLVEFLRASRDPRIKYVIHRGRMFSSYDSYKNGVLVRKAWEWGPYTGVNGHFHHAHISVYGDDGSPWGYPAITEQEEGFMAALSDEEQKHAYRILKQIETDYLTTGKSVRQLIVHTDKTVSDIASGKRPS